MRTTDARLSCGSRSLRLIPRAAGVFLLAATLHPAGAEEATNHRHVEQADLESGAVPLTEAIELGKAFFTVDFNRADGLGDPARPGVNAAGVTTGFNKVNGPDSVACIACHIKPLAGGGAARRRQRAMPSSNCRPTPGTTWCSS